MENFSPKISEADVAAATAKKDFAPRTVVDAGNYTMTIKAAPLVRRGQKSGSDYLTFMLTHTGEQASTGLAVYPIITNSDIGRKQFAELLLSLGFSPAEVVGSEWGRSEATNKNGDSLAIIRAGDGAELSLEGRQVQVYLTRKVQVRDGEPVLNDDGTEREENKVARFVIGA